MLRSFRVANHRSLRDEQELLMVPVYEHPLPALPVAAVYGANASGKSNLLGALRWLKHAVSYSYRVWEPEGGIPREPYRLDLRAAAEPSLFVVDVLLDGTQYVYGVVLDDTAVREEWLYAYPHHHKRVIFERHGQTIELGSTVPERRGRADLLGSLLRENALLLSTAVQAKQAEVLPVYRWFRKGLQFAEDSLSRAGSPSTLAGEVADAIRRNPQFTDLVRAADMDITDLQIVETVAPMTAVNEAFVESTVAEIAKIESQAAAAALDADAARHLELLRLRRDLADAIDVRTELLFRQGPNGVAMAPEDQSAGTLAWVDLLVLATSVLADGTALITDELDASLHPRLTARLIELFRSSRTNPRGAQLVFTTHDATLLGTSLGDEVLRRDEIWFIEKKNGASSLYPLSDFHPRKGENRERRYLAGSYGGVPVIFPDSLVDRLADSSSGVDDPSDDETGDDETRDDETGDDRGVSA